MYIASASNHVKFHEFPSGVTVYNYQPGGKVDGPIKSISWAKDGNWLSLVPHSGYTEIISVKDQLKLIHTVQDVEEPSCASFQNTTKKHLGLGTKSGQVLIYDIKARHLKKRFPRGTSVITHVGFTAKDSHVVAACKNGEVLLYSNTSNNLSGTFRVPRSSSVTTIRPNSHKRHLIIGGSNEGVVVCWDTNATKSKFSIDGHKAPVTAVAFSPINSDLIISAGLDRQFNLYDIESNKCIARIGVENNLTSVDFSHDGLYFVLGSQNGRIFIHDTRNIQEPITIIDSHPNQTVKHLSFQNTSSGSNECSTLNFENVKKTTSTEEVNNHINDSFSMFMVESHDDQSNNAAAAEPENPNNGGDSFMDALGLGQSKSDSVKQDECTYHISNSSSKWLGNNRSIVMESPTHNPTKIIHDRLGLGDSKRFSTPLSYNHHRVEPPQLLSPVISKSNTDIGSSSSVTSTNIRAIAEDVFKKELENVHETIGKEMKFQLMSSTSQIRRMYLDLQMSMIKEFIKLENQYNVIKEGLTLAASPHRDTFLQEENAILRQRIAQLEEEMSTLTNSLSNNTS